MSTGWATVPHGKRVHVVPMNDRQVHILTSACWCKPRQDEEEAGLWVHNSADGREDHEEQSKQ